MTKTENTGIRRWWKALWGFLLPSALWSRRFTAAFAGCWATLLCFDLLWCAATNYRPLGFTATYTSSAALAMLLALPSFLRKGGAAYQLGLLLLVDIFLEANLMYCRTYFEEIPPSSYLLAGNVAEFTDSITGSLRLADLLLPLPALATWFAMRRRKAAPFSWKPFVCTFLTLSALTVCLSMPHGGVRPHIRSLKNQCYYHSAPPVIYTLPLTLVADALESGSAESAESIAFAEEFMARRGRLQLPADSVALPARRNLVFILVESLEAWPIGKELQGQPLTPGLNRLVADSTTWFCPRVYSQAGSGRSIDGQLLMTAGLYPTHSPVYSMSYFGSTYPSLAKELRAALGADTYLLTGDRANTWNQAPMAAAFGIDKTVYRDEWDCSDHFGHTHNPTDKSLYRQITDRMRSGEIWPEGSTALVEILTFSTHHPWVIDPEARLIKLEGPAPRHLFEYCTAVNYADAAIGDFIDYLKTRSDWPETMVVIVGDHEGLNNPRPEIREFEGGKYSELVDGEPFVPMIVLNAPMPGRRDKVMGQIDVYSTVLHQMGVKPKWPGMGFSGLDPDLPSYAAGYPSYPAATSARCDSIIRLIDAQPRAGATIIAADLLRGRLAYPTAKQPLSIENE